MIMLVLRSDDLNLEDLQKVQQFLKSKGADFEIIDDYKSTIRDNVYDILVSRKDKDLSEEEFNCLVEVITDTLYKFDDSVLDVNYIDDVINEKLESF